MARNTCTAPAISLCRMISDILSATVLASPSTSLTTSSARPLLPLGSPILPATHTPPAPTQIVTKIQPPTFSYYQAAATTTPVANLTDTRPPSLGRLFTAIPVVNLTSHHHHDNVHTKVILLVEYYEGSAELCPCGWSLSSTHGLAALAVDFLSLAGFWFSGGAFEYRDEELFRNRDGGDDHDLTVLSNNEKRRMANERAECTDTRIRSGDGNERCSCFFVYCYRWHTITTKLPAPEK